MKSPFQPAGRHTRTPGHLAVCPECASAVHRERQYLERLREAPIPPASDDLTARLLACTSALAAQPVAVPSSATFPRTAVRFLAMGAGGTVAAAGVLAAGAFAAAGDPSVETIVAPAAFTQVAAQTPVDGRVLTADQLNTLRGEGWACPVLDGMGFHLESARAVVLAGQPAVELRLSDGSHYAYLTEQHAAVADAAGQAAGNQSGGTRILGTSPWRATYTSSGRTFSIESDLPAEEANNAGPILQRVGDLSAEGVAAGVDDNPNGAAQEALGSRLQRGINKIVAVFTQ